METSTSYLIAVMLVMALATFITRALPFLLLRSLAEHPQFLAFGRRLPAAILAVLVVYSLSDIELSTPPHGLAHLSAAGLTLLLHAWRRNALLSIIAGTALFMWMQQSGWLT